MRPPVDLIWGQNLKEFKFLVYYENQLMILILSMLNCLTIPLKTSILILPIEVCLLSFVSSVNVFQIVTMLLNAVGASSCISYLAKDMSLNRGATHFTIGPRPCIISSFVLQIYLCPPLTIFKLRPWSGSLRHTTVHEQVTFKVDCST